MTALRYRCRTCGDTHVGLPAWHFEAPAQALGVPPAERGARVRLDADLCVIEDGAAPDGRWRFAKGLLEIPVRGADDPFTWGVWLSLGGASFDRYAELLGREDRPAGESFFGWLCNAVPEYPSAEPLEARLHVRAYPLRPWVELEPTGHPLAVAQRAGMSRDEAIALATRLLHPDAPPAPARRAPDA